LVTNATTATSSNKLETEQDINTEETPPTAKSRLSINNEENQQSDSRSETIDPQPDPSASQDLLEEHDEQQPDGKDNWIGEEANHSDEEEYQSDQDDQGNNKSSDREQNDRHHHQEVEQGHFLQKLGDFADSLQREEEERSEAPVGLPDPGDAIIPPDGHCAEPSGQVEGDTAAGAGPTAYAVYSYIIGLQQQKLEEPSEEPYGLPNPDDALLEPANKKRKMLCGDSRAEGEAAG